MNDSAELFEAIAHPTRIKILKILEKEPSTFASLKRQLNIDSSGNLDHHLKKLDPLITTQPDGLYALTEAGKTALTSVAAVEEWKESERLKHKMFSAKPRMLSVLGALTLTVAVVAFAIVGVTVYCSSFNVPFLPYVYGVAAVLGVLSFLGLIAEKGWGWTLSVAQAALILAYALVPLYFDLYAPFALSRYSTEAPSPFIWVATIFLVIAELGVLFIALRRPVRAFLGKPNPTRMRPRALAAGMLAVFSGLLALYLGCASFFAPVSSVGNGEVSFPLFFFVTGLFIVMGGTAILLRKYMLGGVTVLVFSLFPLPYYNAAGTFFGASTTIGLFPLNLLAAVSLVTLPYIAAALAFLSR